MKRTTWQWDKDLEQWYAYFERNITGQIVVDLRGSYYWCIHRTGLPSRVPSFLGDGPSSTLQSAKTAVRRAVNHSMVFEP